MMCHLITASFGIGVAYALSTSRLSISEVPIIATDVLTRGVGGGGAVELGGFAQTDFSESEAGRRHGIHLDVFGLGAAALFAYCDGAGIDTSHLQGAVGDGGVLLVGAEAVGTRPAEAGTRLVLGGQVDGFAYTVGTAAADQRRQDAAVGGASAYVLERNVTGLVGVVGDKQDVELSCLGVVDVAVFGCGSAIAAVYDIAARQQVACRIDVMEGPPAVEVDVDLGRTVHVDIQVAGFVDKQVVEGGVGGGAEAVGGLSRGSAAFVRFRAGGIVGASARRARVDAGWEIVKSYVGAERCSGLTGGIVCPHTSCEVFIQNLEYFIVDALPPFNEEFTTFVFAQIAELVELLVKDIVEEEIEVG